jgi:hypothetical protein
VTRRRLIYTGVALGVLLVVAGVAAAIALTRAGASNATAVRKGYHLVRAQGPVAHATVTEYPSLLPSTVVDIATGRERPAPLVLEVWWNPKSGFDRVVGRVDGRIEFDTVGQTCEAISASPGRFCFSPTPFDLQNMHYRLPADTKYVRVVGRGSFHGHQVVWLEGLVNGHRSPPSTGFDRVALDVVTHRPVAKRTLVRGRLLYEEDYSVLGNLPGKSVSFVVPNGGAVQHAFPPVPNSAEHAAKAGLRKARAALGQVPLWLGPRFDGHSLRAVEVGTENAEAPNGDVLTRAKFVRFDYGTLRLQEFGGDRPFGFRNGPRPGRIVLDGRATLTRDGLLVIVEPFCRRAKPIDHAKALALAKALRPVRAS